MSNSKSPLVNDIYSSDSDSDTNAPINEQKPEHGSHKSFTRSSFFKKYITGSIPAVGNFSVQYNLSCAAIAIAFMKHYGTYPEPDWSKYLLLSMVFAGAIIGMLTLGFLGDVIGRKKAMIVTLSLVVIGSFASALTGWGDSDDVYMAIGLCRFILGLGVGGIYPLSASASSESVKEGTDSRQKVGWAFFWQTPGAMAPYVVALLMLLLPQHESYSTSLQFRIILGVGALPAFVVLIAELFSRENKQFLRHRSGNPIREVLNHPEYWKHLVGTGGSWFLYDVSYYGTAIFTPNILKDIFGSHESLFEQSWRSLVVSGIGIPGCILGVLLMNRLGGRGLNIWGFVAICLSFASLGTVYLIDKDGSHQLKFALFCIITFALNFGPNVGTFVNPTICFPTEVRSTFHGLSAAGAKIGALVGTFMYSPISNEWGIAAVLWVQVVLSFCGLLVSVYFIDDDRAMYRGGKRLSQNISPHQAPINNNYGTTPSSEKAAVNPNATEGDRLLQ